MDDKEQVIAAYKEMYRAMIAKDETGLCDVSCRQVYYSAERCCSYK